MKLLGMFFFGFQWALPGSDCYVDSDVFKRDLSASMRPLAKRIQWARALLAARFVFFPACTGQHWVLFLLDVPNWRLELYDSYRGTHTSIRMRIKHFLNDILLVAGRYTPPYRTAWQLVDVDIRLQMPPQRDCHSCGVFTVVTALHRSAGLALSFDTYSINQFWRPWLASLAMSDTTDPNTPPSSLRIPPHMFSDIFG